MSVFVYLIIFIVGLLQQYDATNDIQNVQNLTKVTPVDGNVSSL